MLEIRKFSEVKNLLEYQKKICCQGKHFIFIFRREHCEDGTDSELDIGNFENLENFVEFFGKPITLIFCTISQDLSDIFPSFEFCA